MFPLRTMDGTGVRLLLPRPQTATITMCAL